MPTIHVLGLGAGDIDQMPLGVYKKLKQASPLFLRTKEHPVVQQLENQEWSYVSFDTVYEKHDSFDDVYQEIVTTLVEKAKVQQDIFYAIPGHPMVAERTIQLLLEQEKQGECRLQFIGGQSFIDPLLLRLKIDPVAGLIFQDALSIEVKDLLPECPLLITQVYDEFIASEVKLTLMEVYPDEHEVTIATAVGTQEEVVLSVPLYELDRVTQLSNLTAVYIPPCTDETQLNRQYYRSRDIFRELRGPNGCPWDKEQTHQSLKKYMLEEANEVIEAIDEGDIDHLVEELGDVLLQVFLHAQIGEDEGLFSMEDVLQSLNEKMIRRHPHVFGNQTFDDPIQVVEQWEQIKAQEKKQKAKYNKTNKEEHE